MLLDKIETIRQVLVNAIESGLPGAQTALLELKDLNVAMIDLKGMKDDVIQAAIAEQEAEDICNGVISNEGCPPWKP